MTEQIVACSLCGEKGIESEMVYVGQEGDKPRPYCADCDKIDEDESEG